MKKYLFFFIFLILTGCRTTPTPTQSTLRISFASHPSTADPRRSGDFVSSTLICLLYEGLTRCKSGAEIELALAEKVDISADQKTYLFSLRKSRWSDGSPVTAYDFEKSWKEILNPEFPSLCAYLLYPIKNAELCAKGLVSRDEVGIRALDAYTLEVKLEQPTPYFLSLTAFPLFLPVPHRFEESKDLSPSPQLICNGPFLIERISPNTEILLKKNPLFWNPPQVHLDKIHISIVPDETTALQMFERDELDLVGGPLSPLPLDALQNLKLSPNLRIIPMAASTFCTFNTETFPFQNPSLRKAFVDAIDRDQIDQEIARLGQIPATRCLPPSLFLARASPQIHQQDPDMAHHRFQQALSELKIKPTELQSLTLYFKAGQINKRLAQALQRQWKEVLGIQIRLEEVDPKAYLERLHQRNYQIALSSWIAQFHDPINLLERFKDAKNAKNYPGWENRQFSHLLEEAGRTLDAAQRLLLLEEAEGMLIAETPIAPLYHWSSPALFHPRIQNCATTSSGGILFERCSISKN